MRKSSPMLHSVLNADLLDLPPLFHFGLPDLLLSNIPQSFLHGLCPKWENSILIYYFLFFFISIAVYSSRSKASNIGRDWDDFACSKCLFYYQHSQSYSKTSVLDPLHLDVKSHQPLSENLTELISCIPTILWATLSSLYFYKIQFRIH